MPRPKVPLLSAGRIADAALALVDSDRPFSVNALARDLGVTPSSLYNHVDGRDEIIELMRRRMVERSLAMIEPRPWDELVPAVLRAQRRMYAQHPHLLPLIVGKTITDPLVIEHYDILATALLDGGFPAQDVLAIIIVLDAYALGSGLDLAAPSEIWRPDDTTRTLGRLIAEGLSGEARSDHAFEIGVDLLLQSLHQRRGNRTRPEPADPG